MKNSDISKKNKELILRFYENCVLEGLSKPYIIKYMCELKQIALYIKKDFDKATKEDIQKFVRKLQERSDISIHTKHCYKVTLKKFYKRLKGNNEDYPKEVKWIKATIKKSCLLNLFLK